MNSVRRCFLWAVLLLWATLSSAAEHQSFVLDPGWNLITFQVLPSSHEASHVFSAMKVPDASGARLLDPQHTAGSHLKAAFTLDSVNGAHFVWRALENTPYTDPKDLPSRYPFPKLSERQIHTKADTALKRVKFGEAYLLLVEGILPNTTFRIDGDDLAVGMSTHLKAGWNLAGFPFDVTVKNEPKLNIASFFPPRELVKIDRVVAWDSAGAKHESYFPANPEQSRLQFLIASKGYWIYAKEDIALNPSLVVGVPADADLPPLQQSPIAQARGFWNPGPEDVESSPPNVSPVFDTAETQTWIRFPKHEVKLRLPLYNAGGGAIGWTAKVTPFSGTVPDGSVALDHMEAVADVFSLSAGRGLVSAETQVLEVTVDRTRLQPARYLADLSIKPSVGDERRFHVVLESGGLEGQWAGFVTIDTVNGRRNAVPDIDVHLHISADTLDGSRLLRGFIDSQETLLWPSDAPFLGQILEPRGSPRWRRGYEARFVLEGGLTLAPGDLNRFPFDRFPIGEDAGDVTEKTDPETGLAYRTNQDGDRHYFTLPGRAQRAHFSNPTTSFVGRHFQFLGGVASPDGDTPVISGRYVETVTGLLNEPVRLEGQFRFLRVSPTPYERRPLKMFSATPVGGMQRSAGETLEAKVEVDDDVLIHRALVVVAQTADDDVHQLILTAPDGTKITLHDRKKLGPAGSVIFDSSSLPLDALGLLDPPEIRGATPLPTPRRENFDRMRYEARLRNTLAGYVVRQPHESLDTLRNRRGAGTWTLSWTHYDEGQAQVFKGWSLLLFGPRIASISGRVKVVDISAIPTPEPYVDVRLDVVGLPASLGESLIAFDRTTGEFKIDCLPGMRLDVLASKPGFAQAGISGLNNADHPRGFRDNLEGFRAGGPGSNELTIILRPNEGPPIVRSSVSHAVVPSAGKIVGVKDVRLSMFGGAPAAFARQWDVLWEEGSALSPGSDTPRGRSVTVDLQFPVDAFTPENHFTLSVRPRVLISDHGVETYAELPYPLTIALAHPPIKSPYRLIQGGPLAGFGGQMVYVGDVDATGQLGLRAQKTTVTKVDLDRVPRSAMGKMGDEDVDLHPRTFEVREPDKSGYAYALIVETADGRFGRLQSPLPGQAPLYRDESISGRDINAPAEPVAIHSAVGGQIANMGESGSDGEYRISVGATPGLDP